MNKKILKYIALYTVLFIGLFIGCCGIYFASEGKSLFGKIDGLQQHYAAFLYFGIWVNEIWHSIISGNDVPLWNHGIGYGGDIPTTMVAYIFDPFNYLSVVFPSSWSENVYNGIIVVKLYLCGLAYSYFAYYRGHKWPDILAGALIYTFCGSAYIVFAQTYFINPMYLFPLLVTAFDRLWSKGKGGAYIGVLAICWFNHFYFAYMMSIFLFGYGVLQSYEYYCRGKSFKLLITKLCGVALYSVLGIGLSAVVLLPIADNILQQGRMGIDYDLPMLYDGDYYKDLLLSFVRPTRMLERDCIIGFGFITLPLLYVFFRNKGNNRIKIEFILLTLGLCVPYFGHILNGFSYPVNRWVWAYCLVVAYIVTNSVSMLRKSDFKSACLFIFGYAVLCAVLYREIITVIVFAVCVYVAFFWYYALYIYQKKRQILVFISLLVSVILSGGLYFNSKEGKYVKENIAYGTAYNKLTNDAELSTARQVLVNDIRRVNSIQFGVFDKINAAWLYHLSGFGLYMSIYNDKIDQFHRSIALRTLPWVTEYTGLNQRAELETLLGVEYILKPTQYKNTQFAAYNRLVSQQPDNNQEYEVYASDTPTSLVYGFDKAIPVEEYEQFSPYERQQILMQAVVVPETDKQLYTDNFIIENNKIPFTFHSNDELLDYHKLKVKAPFQSHFTIKFAAQRNAELYLYIDGIDYKKKSPRMYTINVIKGKPFNTESMATDIFGNNRYSHIYGNKHEWLVNLGYIKEPIDEIQMYIRPNGLYEIKNLELYARSATDIERNIARLQPLGQNIVMGTNKYTFDAELSKKQYVFISIPYSKGWKAYVNGIETPIIKADIAFMALLLDIGKYHIELKYETPYLRIGFIISLLSAILAFVLIYLNRRKQIK
ncbi:MAG: YfhO family protein [Alphaproteobacteria bacterium]|nr:YfhO family protein [Alphaproteobacteria bacterium]